jgi:hypothetical protein
MAYLAYKVAHPDSWSVSRGYRSGNPNMSVSYVLSLGMLGCLLPDHPMAREWVREALEMMDLWMSQVGPKGEWYESFHYTDVSVRVMVVFAIAARNAGSRDYSQEGTLKKLGSYTAAFYTPRDPQREDVRRGPPLGRSNAGGTYGLQGALARATLDSDPEYSAQMQWLWERTGFSTDKQSHRFGGWEYVYFDRTLPTRRPDWETDLFPQVGVLMRHGLDSPFEHYLAMFTNSDCKFARGSEKGAIVKLFLKGRPIGGSPVGGYWHRHALLMNCVSPARRPVKRPEDLHPYGFEGASELTGFAATPRLDYVGAQFEVTRPWDTWKWRPPLPECLLPWTGAEHEGKPPYRWHRQVLFVKDDDPAAVNYLLLRDTVHGGQPTFWHFWTLSEKIGTPDQVRDRDAFLADKPGDTCVAARRLEGDRFTALGQFDVDLEYFVASPPETPRYTLRFSDTYTYPIPGFVESQDALHLELPNDGSYFVALFPRLRDEAVPEFQSIGDGRIIQVEGPWGTDLGFLSDTPAQVSAAGAEFRGTAAAVQDRPKATVLSLADGGSVRYKAFGIQSDGPATLRICSDRLVVDIHRYHSGQTLLISTRETLNLSEHVPRVVRLTRTEAGYELRLPEGVTTGWTHPVRQQRSGRQPRPTAGAR